MSKRKEERGKEDEWREEKERRGVEQADSSLPACRFCVPALVR